MLNYLYLSPLAGWIGAARGYHLSKMTSVSCWYSRRLAVSSIAEISPARAMNSKSQKQAVQCGAGQPHLLARDHYSGQHGAREMS